MHSHPIIGDLAESREEAINLSIKKYISESKCSKCGFNIRLVSTFQCTRCLRRRKAKARVDGSKSVRKVAKYRRLMAKNLGKTKYRSTPCGKCGELDRLVSTNQCCNCLKKRSNREIHYSSEWARKNRKKLNAKRRSRVGRVRNRRYYRVISKKIEFKVSAFMRSCIRRLLKSETKRMVTSKDLYYTRSDLIEHLESLFEDGMSWDNYGEWHIDHIKPISAFIREGNLNHNEVNALDNLQPLWAKDNISKGGVRS